MTNDNERNNRVSNAELDVEGGRHQDHPNRTHDHSPHGIDHTGSPESDENNKRVKDPVCGMMVDPHKTEGCVATF